VNEAARQLRVAKERQECLRVELTTRPSEVRFKAADGNAKSGKEAVVAQQAREEPW
jgi:hypothetical protein